MFLVHEITGPLVYRKLPRALPFVWPEQTRPRTVAFLIKYLLCARAFMRLVPDYHPQFREISRDKPGLQRRNVVFTRHLLGPTLRGRRHEGHRRDKEKGGAAEKLSDS